MKHSVLQALGLVGGLVAIAIEGSVAATITLGLMALGGLIRR